MIRKNLLSGIIYKYEMINSGNVQIDGNIIDHQKIHFNVEIVYTNKMNLL